MPVAGRGSPPACREAAARSTYQQPAKGGSVYPLTDFFPVHGAWLLVPSNRQRPERHGPLAATGALDKAALAWRWPCPSAGHAAGCLVAPGDVPGGEDVGDPSWVGGTAKLGPMDAGFSPTRKRRMLVPMGRMLSPALPSWGWRWSWGCCDTGGPWRGEQPHAAGPGPVPGQHWDPERPRHPNISPPQATPLPLEKGRAENGPDTSNGKCEPGGRGARRPLRHKAALDAAPLLARAARARLLLPPPPPPPHIQHEHSGLPATGEQRLGMGGAGDPPEPPLTARAAGAWHCRHPREGLSTPLQRGETHGPGRAPFTPGEIMKGG